MTALRPFVLAALVAIALLLGARGALGQTPSASPTASTPSADPMAGITSETLGSGVPSAAPGQSFELASVTFAPDATIPLHTNPGSQIVSVLSGELTLTAIQAGGQLMRAPDADGTPVPTPLEPGGSVVLHAGEGFFFPQGTVHQLHNAGTEPAVIMVATLFAADQPDLVWTNEQGTPIP
ncbi:MAG: cupin domain-containing protein [Chloroflexota bacterium]|nr:cupin domain-containing protein [Chloroflexota bacterium]